MELIDVLNNKREFLGKTCERGKLEKGEFRSLVHVWVINEKGEILIQKRSKYKKHFPNMWGITSGAIRKGETSIDTCIRECKEELEYDVKKENLEYMMSYRKDFLFIDVFVAKQSIDLNKIKMQEEEVSDIKLVTKKELKNIINNNEVAGSLKYFDVLERVMENKMEE